LHSSILIILRISHETVSVSLQRHGILLIDIGHDDTTEKIKQH